jgi:phage portal protein BeeE
MAKTRIKTIDRVKAAWQAFRVGAKGGPMFPVRSTMQAFLANQQFSTKAAPFIWPDWRSGVPQWKMFSYEGYVEEGFNLNTLIYSAIMYKARSMRAAPLKAWTGTPEEREPADPGSKLSKLVARPNPHQSYAEFQDQYIVYINISGNSFTLMDRPTRGGLPEAMYNLRPDRVFVVPGQVENKVYSVLGYLYVPEGETAFRRFLSASVFDRRKMIDGGKVMPIPPDEMMHVKFPNPGDPLEGMGEGLSPISPLARSADVDNAVTHFLKLFFDSGVMASGIISFEDPLDDPALTAFKEKWKEIYGGYERWAEEIMAVSRAKYQRVSLTFDEMGFKEIDERNETRILGPFGVPPILVGSRVGLNASTYSNYEQARKAFWEDTMVPETRLFETEFQFFLVNDGEFVAFDFGDVPALKQNVGELVKAAQILFSMGVPSNQALTSVGLQIGDVPGGDTSYLPLNLIARGGTAPERQLDMEATPEAESETRAALRLLDVKKKALAFRQSSTFTNK